MGDNKIGILYLELAGRVIEKADCYGCINKEEIEKMLGFVFHIPKPKRILIIKELEIANFIVVESNNKGNIRYKINSASAIKKRSDNISKLYHSVGMF